MATSTETEALPAQGPSTARRSSERFLVASDTAVSEVRCETCAVCAECGAKEEQLQCIGSFVLPSGTLVCTGCFRRMALVSCVVCGDAVHADFIKHGSDALCLAHSDSYESCNHCGRALGVARPSVHGGRTCTECHEYRVVDHSQSYTLAVAVAHFACRLFEVRVRLPTVVFVGDTVPPGARFVIMLERGLPLAMAAAVVASQYSVLLLEDAKPEESLPLPPEVREGISKLMAFLFLTYGAVVGEASSTQHWHLWLVRLALVPAWGQSLRSQPMFMRALQGFVHGGMPSLIHYVYNTYQLPQFAAQLARAPL